VQENLSNNLIFNSFVGFELHFPNFLNAAISESVATGIFSTKKEII